MFAQLISFALVGVAITAQVSARVDAAAAMDGLSDVRIYYICSSFDLKYGCSHASRPLALARKWHLAQTIVAPSSITLNVSPATSTNVLVMDPPSTVAVRTLAIAATPPTAEVITLYFLICFQHNLYRCRIDESTVLK